MDTLFLYKHTVNGSVVPIHAKVERELSFGGGAGRKKRRAREGWKYNNCTVSINNGIYRRRRCLIFFSACPSSLFVARIFPFVVIPLPQPRL